MKIAICGKGGCGKSTTTALLAKELARLNQKALACIPMDDDISVAGLVGQELTGRHEAIEQLAGKITAMKGAL